MSDCEAPEQEYDHCTISLSTDQGRRLARRELRQFVLRTLVTLCVSAATTIGLLVVYSRWFGMVAL